MAIFASSVPPFLDLPALLSANPSCFVAIRNLTMDQAALLQANLPTGVQIAVWQPAENFDRPEDRPVEFEFAYAPIVLGDFSDLNDDLGTVAGVTHGLLPLLEWQPHVDKSRTTLIAVVAPGDAWDRTEVKEPASVPLLAEALKRSGYDAIAIKCKAEDEAEFGAVVTLAEEISRVVNLPMLLVSKVRRPLGSVFFMGVLEA